MLYKVPDLIRIEFHEKDGKDWFTLHINRELIKEHGFKALSEFLHKLHVYKSMGDFETAEKFFMGYSQPNEELLKVREIVINNKKPRRVELQPNIQLAKDNLSVEYKDYSEDLEGVVMSFVERWPHAF